MNVPVKVKWAGEELQAELQWISNGSGKKARLEQTGTSEKIGGWQIISGLIQMKEWNMKSFAIIGMGVSGTSVFCQLIDRLIKCNDSETYCIYLYEKKRENLGVGLPYSKVTPKVWLLNGDSAYFKLLPGCESLRTWLEQNKSEWSSEYPMMDITYPPRSLVGLYTKNLYDRFKEKAKNYGIRIEEQFAEVSDIQKKFNNLWYLSTLGKDTEIRVDVVFFCIGHLSSDNFLPLRNKPNYIHQPLDIHRLNSIPKNEEIYVIGSQNTFIDVAKYLFYEADFLGKIITISRNKNIITLNQSTVHFDKKSLNELVDGLYRLPPGSLTLEKGFILFNQMYKKTAKKRIDFNDFTIKSALEEQLNVTESGISELSFLMHSFFYEGGYSAMWNAFTAAAQQEFLNYFYSLMVGYALRIPPINGRCLIELYNKNLLEEITGLQHIDYDENCQRFSLHFLDGNCLKAKYVINATGNGKKLTEHYDEFPLGKKLIENGIIVSSPWGGIETFGQSRVVRGRDGTEQTNFFCIGPLAETGKKPNTYGALLSCIAGQEIFDTLFPHTSLEESCTSLVIR